MGDIVADSWPYMTPLLMVGGGTCRKIPNLAWLHRAILNYGILCHPISFIPCPKFFSSTILNYGILCQPISFIPRPKFFQVPSLTLVNTSLTSQPSVRSLFIKGNINFRIVIISGCLTAFSKLEDKTVGPVSSNYQFSRLH